MSDQIALEVRDIRKRYGGIHALRGVSLKVYKGEVCAFLGENGAGKSTLIKILTGVTQADSGEILLDGKNITIDNPISAKQQGITAIYQESSLINSLTVAQNIMLGHEPVTGALGFLNDQRIIRSAEQYLKKFGVAISPVKKVGELGIGEKRIVEILKALSVNSSILLLDEPTTGMSEVEVECFFQVIRDLKQHHVTMIYISHHLEEIFNICDRVAILRDGLNVSDYPVSQVDKPTLIRDMIGKDLRSSEPRSFIPENSVTVLEVVDLKSPEMKAPLSIQIQAGEILGITGIIGAGKTELGRALFGLSKIESGIIKVNGQEVRIKSPVDAKNVGIGYIPEDRKNQGLFLNHSVEINLTIVGLDQLTALNLFVRERESKQKALSFVEKLRVVPVNIRMLAMNLSGGNQQKIVIGKWLVENPRLLIMDEPTRGVDVGAKEEIYELMKALAETGKSILLLSSEFDEILKVSHRILVLRNGEISGDLMPDEASSNILLHLSMGG